MHDQIYSVLFKEDEVTWQALLVELVKHEDMDIWDINISVLAKKFLEVIHKMKEFDLRVSGKMLLAAAILLKMKSDQFVGSDIVELDRLFSPEEEPISDAIDDLTEIADREAIMKSIREKGLIPRTPQPRKRKVSMYELVDALQKALEVRDRRIHRHLAESTPSLKIPEKKLDISLIIKNIFSRIIDFFDKNFGTGLTFSKLLPSEKKEDKVLTLIPLLHLANKRKIDLNQEIPFGEIEIKLCDKSQTNLEVEA